MFDTDEHLGRKKKPYLCTEGITVFMVMISNQLEFLMARFSRLM